MGSRRAYRRNGSHHRRRGSPAGLALTDRLRRQLLAVGDALDPHGLRGRAILATAIAVAAAVVAGLLLTQHDPAPVAAAPPPVSSSVVAPDPASPSVSTSAPTKRAFSCSRTGSASGRGNAPVRICLPDIRVDASVMKLGLNEDRTVEVPPLSRVGDAGWYKYSAAPGEVGPTVVLGHVDSAQYGEGVFYKLSRLHRGDRVVVSRADGSTADFVIDRVQQVSKSKFPTDEVYGATSGPALRLVTCGGRFDSGAGRYLDNVIAYGTLQSLRAG